ncbi:MULTISPECIES: hypothetical protein, partial [unclassified Bradyrhizobium]|uniref:hypothetical protein n=1 Tax=unclassified Bradyrhizobium TaxID=2631580 RepID=UPI0029163CAF
APSNVTVPVIVWLATLLASAALVIVTVGGVSAMMRLPLCVYYRDGYLKEFLQDSLSSGRRHNQTTVLLSIVAFNDYSFIEYPFIFPSSSLACT